MFAKVLIEELERGDETEREDNNGEPETLSIVEEESEGEETNSRMQDNKENYSIEITEDNCSNSDIENMLKQFPNKVNVGTIIELVTVTSNNDVSTYFYFLHNFLDFLYVPTYLVERFLEGS